MWKLRDCLLNVGERSICSKSGTSGLSVQLSVLVRSDLFLVSYLLELSVEFLMFIISLLSKELFSLLLVSCLR